jgi:hypothetical protein
LLSILLFLSCSRGGGDEEFLMDVHEDIFFTNEFLNFKKDKTIENISKEFEKYPKAVELFYKSALKIDTLCYKESLILNDLKNYFGFLNSDEIIVYIRPEKSNRIRGVRANNELEKSLYPFHKKVRDSIIKIMSEVPMVDIDEYAENSILLKDLYEYPENRFKEDFKGLSNLETILKLATMEQDLSATNLNAAEKLISSIGAESSSFSKYMANSFIKNKCIANGEYLTGKLAMIYFDFTFYDNNACVDNDILYGDNGVIRVKLSSNKYGLNNKKGNLIIDFKSRKDTIIPFEIDYFVK